MPHANDPTVTLCQQLCTPCVRKAILRLSKQEALDIQFMHEHIPTSWSIFTRALAEHCAARRAGPELVYPCALPRNGVQLTPVKTVQEVARTLLPLAIEETP